MEKWIEFGDFCGLRGTAVAENTLLYVLIIVSWHNQLSVGENKKEFFKLIQRSVEDN